MKKIEMAQLVAKHMLDLSYSPDDSHILVRELMNFKLYNLYQAAKILDKIFDVAGQAKIFIGMTRYRIMKNNTKFSIIKQEDDFYIGFSSVENLAKYNREIKK